MADEMIVDGKTFISSKRASESSKYTRDYIGQLCRLGVLECRRLGAAWFVEAESLKQHSSREGKWSGERIKDKQSQVVETGANKIEASVTFDGKEYVSSKRATKLTGYSTDYVGQLAREGKVESKSVGNRWYVYREDLLNHKKRTDSLLAAVQSTAVGFERKAPDVEVQQEAVPVKTHFNYMSDTRPLLPLEKTSESKYKISHLKKPERMIINVNEDESKSDEYAGATASDRRSVTSNSGAAVATEGWQRVPMRKVTRPHVDVDELHLSSDLEFQGHALLGSSGKKILFAALSTLCFCVVAIIFFALQSSSYVPVHDSAAAPKIVAAASANKSIFQSFLDDHLTRRTNYQQKH